MSTRLFVSGLPLGIPESEFRAHFQADSNITDIRLINRRRIGYIGYRTHEEARRAAKYFDRSYIRTSRLIVKLAESIKNYESSESSNQTSEGRLSLSVLPKDSTGKRKRNVSDGETPHPRKKLENSGFKLHILPERDPKTLLIQIPSNQQNLSDKEGHSPHNKVLPAELKQSSVPSIQISDVDWLASKTSRLLHHSGELSQLEPLSNITKNIDVQALDSSENKGVRHTQNFGAKLDNEDDQIGTQKLAISIAKNRRLFVRNIPFTATEDDLRVYFGDEREIEEVHIPLDMKSQKSKGFAYILFKESQDALNAYKELDGQFFQGRLLHVIPSAPKNEHKLDEFAMSKLPLKKQRELKKKFNAASSLLSWNSMYMNSDSVVSSIANRFGISKTQILDATSADAAVQQAFAETYTIQETKTFLRKNGVNMTAFESDQKDERIVLLKNFPFGTTPEELHTLLSQYGELSRFLFPPSGTIVIAEYKLAVQGRNAFASLAYRRFRDGILFLEKGPKGLFLPINQNPDAGILPVVTNESQSTGRPLANQTETNDGVTVFIRNLDFNTTTENLASVLKPFGGLLWCKVKTKVDKKHPQRLLSMGFGFAGFQTMSQAKSAMETLNGKTLDGHVLSLSYAKRDSAADPQKPSNQISAKHKKIIVKNLPFEATKKQISSLFNRYGTLQSLRLPQKPGNQTRGFAFAEFITAREASNALEALKDTHFLGRRLVLEYAFGGTANAQEVIEKMNEKVSRQSNTVKLLKLKAKSKSAVNIQEDGGVEDLVE